MWNLLPNWSNLHTDMLFFMHSGCSHKGLCKHRPNVRTQPCNVNEMGRKDQYGMNESRRKLRVGSDAAALCSPVQGQLPSEQWSNHSLLVIKEDEGSLLTAEISYWCHLNQKNSHGHTVLCVCLFVCFLLHWIFIYFMPQALSVLENYAAVSFILCPLMIRMGE